MNCSRVWSWPWDKISRKVEQIKTLCRTMHADCVKSFVYDSIKAVSADADSEGHAPLFAPETFDRVLLDAPCSALGQRPQIGCKTTRKEIHLYPKLQKKLFSSVSTLFKSSGFSLQISIHKTYFVFTAAIYLNLNFHKIILFYIHMLQAVDLLRRGSCIQHLFFDY